MTYEKYIYDTSLVDTIKLIFECLIELLDWFIDLFGFLGIAITGILGTALAVAIFLRVLGR